MKVIEGTGTNSQHLHIPRVNRYLLAALLGLLAGLYLEPAVAVGWWAALSYTGVSIVWLQFPLVRRLSLGAAFFCFALLLSWSLCLRSDVSTLTPLYGQKLDFSGRITEAPDVRDMYAHYRVQVSHTGNNGEWQSTPFALLLTARRYPELSYGQEIEGRGRIEQPEDFDDFAYRDYLARQGIHAVMMTDEVTSGEVSGNQPYGALLSLKQRVEKLINQLLPEPESSLLSGLLLGSRRGFSDEFKTAMSITGTTHIIAISGYNISILIAVLDLCLLPLIQRKRRFVFLSLGLVAFVLLVGASASVVRAAFMGWVVLASRQTGRLVRTSTVILWTAFIMLVFNPFRLLDLGFQLSFLATLGIVGVYPVLEQSRWFARLTRPWSGQGPHTLKILLSFWTYTIGTLGVTLAAQVLVLPVILYNFGVLSLISPLINVAVLFVIPWGMLLGFVMIILGSVWPLLAFPATFGVWVILRYIVSCIRYGATVPGASVNLGNFDWWMALLWYLVVALLVLLPRFPPFRLLSRRGAVESRVR